MRQVEVVTFKWVVGRKNSKTPQGKGILELAARGVGYYVFETIGDDIVYGFKRPDDGQPLPHHLREALFYEVDKLEKFSGMAAD